MKIRNRIRIATYVMVLLLPLIGRGQSYNMWNYYITPNNLYIHLLDTQNGGTPYAAQRGTWSGTMWGRSVVYDGGDENFQADSLLMYIGTTLWYVGEWRGNWNTSSSSAFFLQPISYMPQTWTVGASTNTTIQTFQLNPSIRAATTGYTVGTAETSLIAHYATYTVPESNVTFSDVIQFNYWPNVNTAPEQYWCANGIGIIRANIGNGNLIAYAEPGTYNTAGIHDPAYPTYSANGVEHITGPVYYPENPFYSPIASPVSYGQAYVWNGSFENGLVGWTIGGETYDGTPMSTPAQRTNVESFGTGILVNGHDESGPHSVFLTGAAFYNSAYTYVTSQQMIPVIPGATYELSAWVYRNQSTSPVKSDSAEVAFDGGTNSSGTSVADGPTTVATYSGGSQPVNAWYQVTAQVTMPADVYNTAVICSRTGFLFTTSVTTGTYFDDVRLTLVSLPSGYVIPGT